ncbi:O-antigen translocase [Prevotella sp. 10(H)]|uniref:O-antigen translocase n=1 Tax=Prevotella sp. 10(H) TaxID=1158294 RepID=UPI0004A6C620|nr:O-antigen translocase [Prevotella sp. 10(H)]
MKKDNSSYNQILKSTSIFGGSQVIIILIGIVRSKIIAVLLGPAGVGFIGICYSIIDTFRAGCGLGMDTAGVKEIAEANNSENKQALYRTIARFNKWFKVSAIAGAIACIIFCYPISIWASGDDEYALRIAGLSVAVLLSIITTGRSTILQGMRRIPEMAKSAVLGSFFGLLFTAPLYFIFGIQSIVPAFIGTGLISFFCVEYYYRRQRIPKVALSNKEAFQSGLNTLKLGIYIVIAGFIGTISMFLVRTYLSRSIDIDAAGLFQSAWVITNIYLSLILRSMGTDFFPRLSAIAGEKDKIKQLVNEQTYIILVVASPAIVTMLLFSDFALSVLYTSKFEYASDVLRWQILGTFFKVLSWPMAFIMLAKNKGSAFLFTEVIFYAVYLLSAYLLFPSYGLDATGIGYLIAYIIYLPMVFIFSRNISDFVWRKDIIRMALINAVLITAAFFTARLYYTEEYALIPGAIILIITLIYAYFKLKRVFNFADLKDWFRKR